MGAQCRRLGDRQGVRVNLADNLKQFPNHARITLQMHISIRRLADGRGVFTAIVDVIFGSNLTDPDDKNGAIFMLITPLHPCSANHWNNPDRGGHSCGELLLH